MEDLWTLNLKNKAVGLNGSVEGSAEGDLNCGAQIKKLEEDEH